MNRKVKIKNAFTLAEGGHSPLLYGDEGVAEGYSCVETRGHKVLHASKNMSFHIIKKGFTLAEVLITLGIIGVVAAMTLPTLIQNYKRHEVETRLAKFYTTINQAIQMSETVNGDKMYWEVLGHGFEKDEEGNVDKTKSIPLAWFNKYLRPYLNNVQVVVNDFGGRPMIYFNDGSLCLFDSYSWHFYPNAKDFKQYTISDEGKGLNPKEISGIKYFTFFFSPWTNGVARKYHYKKGVEPYKVGWDGTKEMLFNKSNIGCNENATNERAYCAALIQMNGWKIPKDYPLKF